MVSIDAVRRNTGIDLILWLAVGFAAISAAVRIAARGCACAEFLTMHEMVSKLRIDVAEVARLWGIDMSRPKSGDFGYCFETDSPRFPDQ